MIRFVVIFVICILVLVPLDLYQPVQTHVILPFTTLIAHVCVGIMHIWDNNVVAQNGQAQNEVTNTQGALTQRQTMLQGLVGNITTADLAQASTNLQQAQLSIQAAGQVFQALNNSSLLNILQPTPAIA